MSIMEADLHNLKINDPFLGQYQRLVRDVVIPYQWDALNDRVAEAGRKIHMGALGRRSRPGGIDKVRQRNDQLAFL